MHAQGSIRWWPAILILGGAASAALAVHRLGGGSFQQRNIVTMLIVVGTILLLVVWLLVGARLRAKTRWGMAAGLLAVCGLVPVLFEIEGVTGDVLPILRLRWAKPVVAGERLAGADPAAVVARPGSARGDFPQFLGPNRNAIVADGTRLARDWHGRPPQLVWRQTVGAAWSGFAVVGDRAITQEQRGEEETVVCYGLGTGGELWMHADLARYHTTTAGEGPRCTPTVTGDRVLTLGATGILNCLDLGTGRRIWSTNIVEANEARLVGWGAAGSPLVLGAPPPGGGGGRSLVAYDLATGAFVWGGGDDPASYSSPCTGVLGGVSQVLIFNQPAVVGHEAATGRVLWRYGWGIGQPHVALPLVLPGDRVLVSSGYGVGSELLQIRRLEDGAFDVQRVWKSIRLKSKFNNLVEKGGYVYGLDDGILVCLEVATGELQWKGARYGHGQFLLVSDLLLVTAENGDVVMIEPVPDEPRELGRFAALRGKTWNPPALAGEWLLMRNHREAACWRLPADGTSASRQVGKSASRQVGTSASRRSEVSTSIAVGDGMRQVT